MHDPALAHALSSSVNMYVVHIDTLYIRACVYEYTVRVLCACDCEYALQNKNA